MKIGATVSAANGYTQAVKTAISIGADTFQVFSRNPRGGAAAELDLDDIAEAKRLMAENGVGPILIHAPYTLNMATAKEASLEFARDCFQDDMKRMLILPSEMYVFHPGSRTKLPYDDAIRQIAEVLRLGMIEDSPVWVLLETMSGKGSEIGSRFEELRDILDAVGDFYGKKRLGVCLDLCHMYCAGYDIVNDADGVFNKLDDIIGFDRVKAVHLNDTANPFASKRDRHARIGEGFLGVDAVRRVMRHERLRGLPFFLETPHLDVNEFADEIKLVR